MNADGVGTVGNPVCGDLMTMYIKVKDDRIVDIKFKTYGPTRTPTMSMPIRPGNCRRLNR